MARNRKEDRRVTEETRKKRREGIEEPVLDELGHPILTSIWCPSQKHLREYKSVPFYAAVTFTGRTFPFVVRNLLQLYSKEGEMVYDPMLGSGTTLYEAVKLGRVAMGSDLNRETVKNFRIRWKKHCAEPMPRTRPTNAENLSHLDDDSIDLIIMSFPWFVSWSFADKKRKEQASKSMEKNKDIPSFVAQSTRIYRECARVIKPGGKICNILGNTFRAGKYYPITLHTIKAIEAAKLEIFYQFWSLRVRPEFIKFPWNRSTLDCTAKKARAGIGWDMHEDIIIAQKPEE